MKRTHDLDTGNARASGPASLYDSPESNRPDISNGEAAAKRRPMDISSGDGRQVADSDVALFRTDNRKF